MLIESGIEFGEHKLIGPQVIFVTDRTNRAHF
jgi:hypothetical protein